MLPGAHTLLPHLLRRPLTLVPLVLAAAGTAALAIAVDTAFYGGAPVITPLNNILYNADTANLAQHGLHPRYTHLLVNLPQLLGPALLTLTPELSLPVLSAAGGVLVLSALPHQEARFLLPCVPLLLAAAKIPASKAWLAAWLVFNSVYGVFLGVFHQAGIVPAQQFLAATAGDAASVVYWKTYNPPTWLLGARSGDIETLALMGAPVPKLVETLERVARCEGAPAGEGYLAAPLSAVTLDALVDDDKLGFKLESVWSTTRHLNMDDLEFGDDGVVETVKRVVGRRGLGVWKVQKRECSS